MWDGMAKCDQWREIALLKRDFMPGKYCMVHDFVKYDGFRHMISFCYPLRRESHGYRSENTEAKMLHLYTLAELVLVTRRNRELQQSFDILIYLISWVI